MILDEIVASKKERLKEVKSALDERELKARVRDLPPTRDFGGSLKLEGTRIIAEAKKASPSKGLIREDFDAPAIARGYESAGAAAVSVLTEEDFFLGSLEDLKEVRAAVGLPLLRKDFLFDPYQLLEARASGADAVLLIAAVLEAREMSDLIGFSAELGMDTLLEVHNEDELSAALQASPRIVGINNRDLKTFKTDIGVTERLAPLVQEGSLIVSESGINTKEDIERLKGAGVDAFLIGEALVREADPGEKLKELLS